MRTSISTLLQLGLVLLLLLFTNGTFGQPLRKSDLKARKLHTVREDQAIVQQYILRFKDDVTMSDSELDQRSNELATSIGATIVWVYKSAIKGFTFLLNDANTDLDTILAEDDVEGIEQVTSRLVTLYEKRSIPISICVLFLPFCQIGFIG